MYAERNFKMTKTEAQTKMFENAYRMAVIAGQMAGENALPTPMIVTAVKGPSWYVSDGVCGFAWVTIKPGISAFAKWLAKKGYAKSAYGGGMQIWISQFGQSMARKEACARAMADVFQTELGIKAVAGSRMD